MNWEWAEVNLSDVVQESLNGTKALLTQRDLNIESNLDSSLPTVWNDRDILLQVMTNLLGNSIKFTPNGGKVSINARKLDPNESVSLGEMLEVSVTDRGSGIRSSEHEIIFQKFMQAGSGASNRRTGTGLGLSICKEIVEYTGGKI